MGTMPYDIWPELMRERYANAAYLKIGNCANDKRRTRQAGPKDVPIARPQPKSRDGHAHNALTHTAST
ncbi:hypothetical protein BraRD5C2_67570 [Bradyrhizobium sp. RD5-C2]|nr:hypothetical protein BraRD5C2_67570 [Bradyrhizobium sp. RD5-C2]